MKHLKPLAVKHEPKMKHSYVIVIYKGNKTSFKYAYSKKDVRDRISELKKVDLVEVFKSEHNFVGGYVGKQHVA